MNVQILSGIDQLHRRVWYGVVGDARPMRTESYADALSWAEAFAAEHDCSIIDRSDRNSGILRSQLG